MKLCAFLLLFLSLKFSPHFQNPPIFGIMCGVMRNAILLLASGLVLCALAEKQPVRAAAIGIQDVFGYSGPAKELLKEFGIDSEGIFAKIKEIL